MGVPIVCKGRTESAPPPPPDLPKIGEVSGPLGPLGPHGSGITAMFEPGKVQYSTKKIDRLFLVLSVLKPIT